MSWMDSASGSSTFHGGGGLSGNNGNVGAGTGYGGNGGNNYSSTGGLGGGLSTGNTWHGNTAFGPSGGRVTAYAHMRDGGGMFGMMPTRQTYTNYRNPAGQSISGPGKNKGTKDQQTVAPTGGLLDEEVVVTPPPPPEVFNPYAGFKNYPFPHPTMAGGWMGAQNWNNFAGNWPGNNVTDINKTPAGPGGGSTHYKNNLR